MAGTKHALSGVAICALALWISCPFAELNAAPAQTPVEHVIHTFANFPHGANPYAAPLTRDANGNLDGTTCQGGPANQGVVFKLN